MAKYSDKDGFVYFPFKLNETEEAFISASFDHQCDIDEDIINAEIKSRKELKRVCLFKVLLFIPEFFFTLILFGKATSYFKLDAFKLYWKMLFNKIDVETFEKNLLSIMENGKIGLI